MSDNYGACLKAVSLSLVNLHRGLYLLYPLMPKINQVC